MESIYIAKIIRLRRRMTELGIGMKELQVQLAQAAEQVAANKAALAEAMHFLRCSATSLDEVLPGTTTNAFLTPAKG